jgi:parallel beta-helix repeat protein
VPGATVYVMNGTYVGFTLTKSGTSAAPIQILAYAGAHPVIDGSLTSLVYTVTLQNVSYVDIEGLTVQGGYADLQVGGGVLVNTSSHVTLRNDVVRNNKAFGIRVLNGDNVLIEKDDVYGNAIGLQVSKAVSNITVQDNTIHENNRMAVNTPEKTGDDVGGEAIAIVQTTGSVLVQRNQIWGNRAVSYDYGYDGGAFSIYAASNWTIQNNTTWDNRNILETGTDATRTPCDHGTFVHNLNYAATSVDRTVGMLLRCASNTLVANNTFVGIQYFVFDISSFKADFGGSIEGLRILNNVVSVSTGNVFRLETALPASVVIDYNLYLDTATDKFGSTVPAAYQTMALFAAATGYEAHGLSGDPLFVNAAQNNYHLGVGSPAIDSGTILAGVTDGFNGSAPDRGYVEAPP